MKALFLTTHTADCENKWRSLCCLGHAVQVIQYDDRPHDRHLELIEEARLVQPDIIVYLGAIEKYHGRPVPSTDVLRWLNDVAPMVHLCGDASDEPWWDLLREYCRLGCFAVQVSIDGSPNTPIAGFPNGMIRLTPVDPGAFPAVAWPARSLPAGMAGGRGHGERAALIQALWGSGAGLGWRLPGGDYADMAEFLTRCKVVVNCPMNGTGNGDHVKGRVVEAGWAGACLLERSNPVTSRWFRAGVDYLVYEDAEDAVRQLVWAREHDEEVESMANRFRARVEESHHPKRFWSDVFAKAGVTAT